MLADWFDRYLKNEPHRGRRVKPLQIAASCRTLRTAPNIPANGVLSHETTRLPQTNDSGRRGPGRRHGPGHPRRPRQERQQKPHHRHRRLSLRVHPQLGRAAQPHPLGDDARRHHRRRRVSSTSSIRGTAARRWTPSSSSIPRASIVRSFGKGYYPGGHGIDIRKEGGEQFLYLCDIDHRQVIKTNLKGEEVWKLSYPMESGVYKRVKQYQSDQRRLRPGRRLLRRRRLRLQLHPSVRQERQVGPHLGRHGNEPRQDADAAWHVAGRSARPQAVAGRRRSRQRAACNTSRWTAST